MRHWIKTVVIRGRSSISIGGQVENKTVMNNSKFIKHKNERVDEGR